MYLLATKTLYESQSNGASQKAIITHGKKDVSLGRVAVIISQLAT